MTYSCYQVQYGTKEYEKTLALRDDVLRKPLGLKLIPEELTGEESSFHLTCWNDNMILACLVLQPLPNKLARMRQFAVHADYRGQGIGSALIDYSESFIMNHGYEKIVLHARETALGFYKKMGYHSEGDRFTEVSLPHFSMQKKLLNNRV